MPMTARRKHGQKQKKERNIFMTKPGDSQTKKTIYELSQEFPEKTYKELEKYRDADRQQEAQQIITQQENEELKEDQGKEIDYHRYWKDQYEKEHKLRQEAEGELTIIKGIGNTSPEMRGAKEKIHELQSNLDKIKKENNDLYNRIAELKEAELAAHGVQKARESGL